MKRKFLCFVLTALLVLASVPMTAAVAVAEGPVVYYVYENGSDTNDGLSEAKALATIDKAYELAGNADEIVFVIKGSVIWPSFTCKDKSPSLSGKNITITGKYGSVDNSDGAILQRTETSPYYTRRPIVSNGSLKLDYLTDKLPVGKNNFQPIDVINATFETGEGYKLIYYASNTETEKTDSGAQIFFKSGASSNIIVGGATFEIGLGDYGSATHTGDIGITVNSGAKVTGSVHLGGDSGAAANIKVQGGTFVTVNDNTSKTTVIRGGYKPTTSVTLNGLQVIFNDSPSWTIVDNTKGSSYTNNGKEYVVRTTGLDAESVALGEINLSIPDGYVAVYTNGLNVDSVETSGEFTLAEGVTEFKAVSAADFVNMIPVYFNGSKCGLVSVGETYTIPDGLLGYGAYLKDGVEIDGSYTATADDKTVGRIDIVGLSYTDNTIYVDSTNGNDDNYGESKENAVKEPERAIEILASLGAVDATIKLADSDEPYIIESTGNTYFGPSTNTPKSITILGDTKEGSVVKFNGEVFFRAPLYIDNVTFDMDVKNKFIHICKDGFYAGENVITEGPDGVLPLKLGVSSGTDSDYDAVIKSGKYSIKIGRMYIKAGSTATYDKNISIEAVGEGTEISVGFGDGYQYGTTDVRGNMIYSGDLDINVTGGAKLNRITATYLYQFTGNANINYDNVAAGADPVTVPGIVTKDAKYLYEATQDGVSVSDVTAASLFNSESSENWGGQIRFGETKNDYDLRFVIELNKNLEDATKLADIGAVVFRRDVLGDGNELFTPNTDDKYAATDGAIVISRATLGENFKYYDTALTDSVLYTACITDIIGDTDYSAEKFVVRPYVLYQVNGVNYYAYGELMEFSLDDIASLVLDDTTIELTPEQQTILSEIIG